jgi:hypothetical protein
MAVERQRAAQLAQQQQVSIQNVNAARTEAERHLHLGSFTTVPTPSGNFAIGRQNVLGYSAPTVNFRSLTPNGSPVGQAMSPSAAFRPNIVVNGQQNPTSTVNPRRFL